MPDGTNRKTYLAYGRPEDVITDAALSGTEKRRLLDDWKTDLELMATADQENMPDLSRSAGRSQRPATAELLQRVDACRRQLEEQNG